MQVTELLLLSISSQRGDLDFLCAVEMLLELPRTGSIFRGCADSRLYIVRSSWSSNSKVGVSGDCHVPVTCIGCGGNPRPVAM